MKRQFGQNTGKEETHKATEHNHKWLWRKNTKHSPKIKQGVGQTEPDLVAFHDTGGQQTDRVYTSMSGARTGRRAVA